MRAASGERVAEYFETKGREQTLTRPPLVVDLDGTLVRTDLLIESLLALLRKQPLFLFMLPLWIARGKACFKHEVARRVSLEVAALPWRSEFIDYLRRQRAEGRSLVLATGADMRIARRVADHLKLFDTVLASDGTVNLCGEAKRDRLVNRFGERGSITPPTAEAVRRMIWRSGGQREKRFSSTQSLTCVRPLRA